MRLSLKYGGGNLRWFYEQTREDQVRLLAFERVALEANA